MRLIDLDALMQFPIRWNHYDIVNGSEKYIFGVEAVLEYAENLPTVDAEPVRHGEWISEIIKAQDWKGRARDYYQPHSCSICHKPDPCQGVSNYCPNCGAKMDGNEDAKHSNNAPD